MRFAIQTNGVNGHVHASAHELATELVRRGGQCTSFEDRQLQFVLNLSDMESPRTFRRKHKSVFVVTLAAHPAADDETIKRNGYRTLIRTFSNLMICLVPNGNGRLDAHYITPEVGYYTTPFDADAVCERIAPI
ncbi:MAG: hypothetical protein H7X80_01400, partial [bacterium]|nr:hypothetical protein [Candidatus Kapabacteria bacterium]